MGIDATRLALALFTVFALAGCAGGRAWTKADTARQAAYSTLHVLDWAQTRDIATRTVEVRTPVGNVNQSVKYNAEAVPAHSEAVNVLLGAHPSEGRVNAWFAASLVGHALISYALPHPWRERWQYATTLVEAGMVGHNAQAGIRFRW